jgi:hypothetical protein
LLLTSQPFFSLLTITNPLIKYVTLILYFIYIIYKFITNKFNNKSYITSVGKNGHLRWDWISNKPLPIILYMFCMFFPILFWGHPFIFIIGIITLIISLILYRKDNTWGSLWCWTSNIISIYLIYCIFAKEFCF